MIRHVVYLENEYDMTSTKMTVTLLTINRLMMRVTFFVAKLDADVLGMWGIPWGVGPDPRFTPC